MRQMYSCPNCNSQVNYGDEFCLECGTQMVWQRQSPPPPFRRIAPVAPMQTFQPRQPLYEEEDDYYDEEELLDFRRQKKSKWQEEDLETGSNWRKVVIPMLAFLIVVGIAAVALQVTGFVKLGTGTIVASNIAPTITTTPSNGTLNSKPTTSNVTAKQPSAKQPVVITPPVIPQPSVPQQQEIDPATIPPDPIIQ
jgi:hypothetical protein